MADVDRVTVTLPNNLVRDIDRREKNRSKFIAEAVRNELDRRRRDELHRSLDQSPPRERRADTRLTRGRCRGTRRSQRRQNDSVGLRRRLGGAPRVKLGRGAVVVEAEVSQNLSRSGDVSQIFRMSYDLPLGC